jgi:hypothetical protein
MGAGLRSKAKGVMHIRMPLGPRANYHFIAMREVCAGTGRHPRSFGCEIVATQLSTLANG